MAGGVHFLYRTDQGRIDRGAWLNGALPLIMLMLPLTMILREALQFANRPLSERAFYDLPTIAANSFILVYALAMLLIAISWVNLGAKRFRDRGRPAPLALAGLLPLAMFAAAAAHWLQPRVAEIMPRWSVTAADALVIAVALWTLAEMLNALPARSQP